MKVHQKWVVSINLEIIMYIESKENETVTVPNFTYEQ